MEETATHTISDPVFSMADKLDKGWDLVSFNTRMGKRLADLRAKSTGEGSDGNEEKSSRYASKERTLS